MIRDFFLYTYSYRVGDYNSFTELSPLFERLFTVKSLLRKVVRLFVIVVF